tara:strand:+ start:2334 stop:2561 length:228 start_codon:yes stop_codon:yes gene_type:complete
MGEEFQSTPLREGRLYFLAINIFKKLFQSTPLREGRLDYETASELDLKFQSTPLREGRLLCFKPSKAVGKTMLIR